MNFHVQIGVRLVLPLIALGIVGIASAMVDATRRIEGVSYTVWTPRFLITAAVASLAWMTYSSALIWPNALCFVNELWGGSREGYRLVSDSNYDWGQGVPELAEWVRRHPETKLEVWYFGTDPQIDQIPVDVVPLHKLPIAQPEDVRRFVRGPLLAVGTTLIYGQGITAEHNRAAAYLRQFPVVDRTTTFLILDIREPSAHSSRLAEERVR